MVYHPVILVDSSVLVAFYDASDDSHGQAREFFATCRSELITTVACVNEVMWLLSRNWRVQNEFLSHLASGIYECEALLPEDFARIAELNEQYADLPGDFADLSLVAIAERLNIWAIATLDRDFYIYRLKRDRAFDWVFFQ